MGKRVLFVGPPGSGTTVEAERIAYRARLFFNAPKVEKILYKGSSTAKLGYGSSDAAGLHASNKRESDRLLAVLKHAKHEDKTLYVQDLPLFFLGRPHDLEEFLADVKHLNVKLIATSAETETVPLGLFDKVYLGQSYNPCDLYHHERNKLGMGDFITLKIEHAQSPMN